MGGPLAVFLRRWVIWAETWVNSWLMSQEFTQVSAQITTLDKKTASGPPLDLDDNARLTLQTAGRAAGTVEASWTYYGVQDNSTIIACENGVLSLGAHSKD